MKAHPSSYSASWPPTLGLTLIRNPDLVKSPPLSPRFQRSSRSDAHRPTTRILNDGRACVASPVLPVAFVLGDCGVHARVLDDSESSVHKEVRATVELLQWWENGIF